MQLKNDNVSFETLFNTISSFYASYAGRRVLIFEEKFPSDSAEDDYFVRCLVDAKHVIEYRITNDRGYFLSVLSLAIGPHYFAPADFWDYANSQRFDLEASAEAIVHNLKLLDEFLGQCGRHLS